jgi:hypothetical protein
MALSVNEWILSESRTLLRWWLLRSTMRRSGSWNVTFVERILIILEERLWTWPAAIEIPIAKNSSDWNLAYRTRDTCARYDRVIPLWILDLEICYYNYANLHVKEHRVCTHRVTSRQIRWLQLRDAPSLISMLHREVDFKYSLFFIYTKTDVSLYSMSL